MRIFSPETYLPAGNAIESLQHVSNQVLLPYGYKRRVVTREDKFFNRDRFTYRMIFDQIVKTLEQGDPLTMRLVIRVINKANLEYVSPLINVPMEPGVNRVGLVPKGGVIHECLHTLYECIDDIEIEECHLIYEVLKGRSKFENLTIWLNEVHDVEIEREGRKTHPGFILPLLAVHRYRVKKAIIDWKKGIFSKEVSALHLFRHVAFGYMDKNSKTLEELIWNTYPALVDYFRGPEIGEILARRNLGGDVEAVRHALDIIEGVAAVREAMDESRYYDMGKCRLENNSKRIVVIVSDGKGGYTHGYIPLDKLIEMAMDDEDAEIEIDSDTEEQDQTTHKIIYVGRNEPLGNRAKHKKVVDRDVREFRSEVHYLKSRLRSKIKCLELVDENHGVENGIDFSDKCLIDTAIALQAGRYPQKFEWNKGEKHDTSLAAHLLLDMSSSMWGRMNEARKVVLSLIDPLESLRCSTMCSGFEGDWNGETRYHVFKQWQENYRQVRWRLNLAQSNGCTPMYDAMLFAYNSLQHRPEGNRILAVATDGMPNDKIDEIKELIDVSSRAGMVCIGIGFGHGAQYVKEIFPHHVWREDISDIPKAVTQKMLAIISSKNRGKILPLVYRKTA